MQRSRGTPRLKWWVGGAMILRLALALSFASHAAALAFVAWLGSRPPAIPESPAPHTIPLIFIEPDPPPDQAAPVPPVAGPSDPAAAQTPSPPVEQPASAEPPAETPRSSASATEAAPHSPETPTAGPLPPVQHATAKPAAKKSGPAPAAKQVRREAPKPPPPAAVIERRDASRTARSLPSAASRPSDPAAAPQAPRPPEYPPAVQAYPSPAYPPPSQAYHPPADPRGSQLATVAAPRPAPPAQAISAEYRGALSTWLERHKVYPEAARQRGEEGSAVLHFRIDRYGRVLTYQLTRSTGFAELDAAIDRMMQGATLPPFPASMTQPEIAVSVPIRFSLNR